MALPVTFGPLTAAQMSELDQNFAAVGALTTIRNSATGTNAIVLTPAANQPAVSGYGLPNPVKFSFLAAATSTGAVTLEVSSFGFLPVYTPNGIQATTGTLVIGNYYEVTYTTGSIYNSGNGAWVLSSYQSGTGTIPLAGSSVRGWKSINNAGTPNTQIDISFQQACLVSATGTPTFLGILSATIDLTTGTVTATANGMDGESRPASGWVYIYAISTGSGMAGLGTTVSPLVGPPTLPAGYAYYAYLEARWCDGSSNLRRSRQLGNRAGYVVTATTNTANYPIITNSTNGWPTSVSVATFVPPTAESLYGLIFATSTENVLVGPNGNTAAGSATNPTAQLNPGSGSGTFVSPFSFVLEGTSIDYGIVVGGSIAATGWTDYVSAAA